VYDGDNTAAPQIGCNAWQVPWAITASPANQTGCLTFEYQANGSGDNFSGDIHCNFQCQHSEVQLISTSPAYVIENGNYYINICEGQDVTFNVQGNYANVTYPQSDATSTFHWNFGDGDSTSAVNLTSVTHTFTGHQGYTVTCDLDDGMKFTQEMYRYVADQL
jgi:plastocyanin